MNGCCRRQLYARIRSGAAQHNPKFFAAGRPDAGGPDNVIQSAAAAFDRALATGGYNDHTQPT